MPTPSSGVRRRRSRGWRHHGRVESRRAEEGGEDGGEVRRLAGGKVVIRGEGERMAAESRTVVFSLVSAGPSREAAGRSVSDRICRGRRPTTRRRRSTGRRAADPRAPRPVLPRTRGHPPERHADWRVRASTRTTRPAESSRRRIATAALARRRTGQGHRVEPGRSSNRRSRIALPLKSLVLVSAFPTAHVQSILPHVQTLLAVSTQSRSVRGRRCAVCDPRRNPETRLR